MKTKLKSILGILLGCIVCSNFSIYSSRSSLVRTSGISAGEFFKQKDDISIINYLSNNLFRLSLKNDKFEKQKLVEYFKEEKQKIKNKNKSSFVKIFENVKSKLLKYYKNCLYTISVLDFMEHLCRDTNLSSFNNLDDIIINAHDYCFRKEKLRTGKSDPVALRAIELLEHIKEIKGVQLGTVNYKELTTRVIKVKPESTEVKPKNKTKNKTKYCRILSNLKN